MVPYMERSHVEIHAGKLEYTFNFFFVAKLKLVFFKFDLLAAL